ncbi:MAG: NlpC/P60 family protein [Luteolibacter sp.]|nr:NlpC/P60 family protein [Luteolibacter sp.]
MSAQTTDPAVVTSRYGRPALIASGALLDFDSLPEDRRMMIEEAIAVARDSPWLVYTARGASPSDGGFDCSGAMYFVMRKAGLDPPRVAAAQLQWLKRHDRFHEVPAEALGLQHAALGKLMPGDLLFWGRRGSVAAASNDEITHVAMFLGREKTDKRPVMINSTDGRSYRGTRANGYGVYDFRLPSAGSRIAFIGYGTPPGIAAIP